MLDPSTPSFTFCESVGMRIVTLDRGAEGKSGHVWPEAIASSAVERCLAVIEARDPLTLPAERTQLETADRVALAMGPAGEIQGLAWRVDGPEGPIVDVRVQPGLRRHGIGSALLDAVADGAGGLRAGCDAAHPRVRRFLVHRDFMLRGVVFHQRWDGETRDVPAAFASAQLVEPDDLVGATRLLTQASADAWPRPSIDPARSETGFRRVALRSGAPAGVLMAHRERDAWDIDGLAVLPAQRRAGVGRQLLVELMRVAAAEGAGVTLRIAQTDEETLAWAQKLGFWTYRTWAEFVRP
jgi:ribosomal protein S18 acetylase RimI-like enzyme